MNQEFNTGLERKKDLFRLALFTGELMLRNGAETYRVEDTILRICHSRGFRHVSVFTSSTAIIISDERFDGLTFMKTIKNRGINLNKINLLNNFSRDFVSNKDLSIEQGIKILKKIEVSKSYDQWIIYIGTGLGSACFAVLLGATFADFILTFITSIFAVIIFDKMFTISSISSFSTLAASIFIAVVGVSLSSLGLLSKPNMLIVGSIMPLLPGVALIKGLRDLISGDLISGVARAFDALLTAMAIAFGVGFILEIWLKLGGVL